MTYWNPRVIKINSIAKHPNADALEIVDVDFPVITKLDQYKLGDLVSYIPVDTIVNLNSPIFKFLTKEEFYNNDYKPYRIRAKKLRGTYSEGLIVDAPVGFSEGDSIVEFFDLKKYVHPEELAEILELEKEELKRYYISKEELKRYYISDIPTVKVRASDVEAPPKGWVARHYDLDPLRSNLKEFQDGEEVVLNEKLDGANMFMRHDGSRLWVKSRNLFKKPDQEDLYWGVAYRGDFENKLSKYPQYGFFGECYGQVNPFRYDAEIINGKLTPRFRLFDIYEFQTGSFLSYNEMVNIAKELEIDIVPELYRGPWFSDKRLYDLAEQPTLLPSKLDKACNIMEGFVIRPIKERTNHSGRVIYKFKGQKYLLFK